MERMFLKPRFLLKVMTGVAQPVPFGQGQQFLPVHPQNPGAFVQNPSGMYFLNFMFFKRQIITVLLNSYLVNFRK